jgi:hypothetical protein
VRRPRLVRRAGAAGAIDRTAGSRDGRSDRVSNGVADGVAAWRVLGTAPSPHPPEVLNDAGQGGTFDEGSGGTWN